MRQVWVIFDGPPGPESGRFVEVETDDGKSVRAGVWAKHQDGTHSLGPFYTMSPDYQEAVRVIRETVRLLERALSHIPGEQNDLRKSINDTIKDSRSVRAIIGLHTNLSGS